MDERIRIYSTKIHREFLETKWAIFLRLCGVYLPQTTWYRAENVIIAFSLQHQRMLKISYDSILRDPEVHFWVRGFKTMHTKLLKVEKNTFAYAKSTFSIQRKIRLARDIIYTPYLRSRTYISTYNYQTESTFMSTSHLITYLNELVKNLESSVLYLLE